MIFSPNEKAENDMKRKMYTSVFEIIPSIRHHILNTFGHSNCSQNSQTKAPTKKKYSCIKIIKSGKKRWSKNGTKYSHSLGGQTKNSESERQSVMAIIHMMTDCRSTYRLSKHLCV